MEVSHDGAVKAELIDVCGECPMSQMALRMSVEGALKPKAPQIKRIVGV